ncbi:uncharacterized protein METZ01_LOCUS263820, partial [marine metagenome]
MRRIVSAIALSLCGAWVSTFGAGAFQVSALGSVEEITNCEDLLQQRNLTITYAGLAETSKGKSYCYVKGLLLPAVHFHVQLPLPGDWNGRFLKWGDGGKDGDLDFADHRVTEGYAVANSNTGHDNGAEPGSSFGYHNRQAEIDFGYRAVHLTTMAAKTMTGKKKTPARCSRFTNGSPCPWISSTWFLCGRIHPWMSP